MEANELRLGNYCEYYIEDKMEKHDPGFWVRNKIDLQDIECCLKNKEHFDKFYRAIPLTPEILEKCGFKLDLKCIKYKGKLYRKKSVTVSIDSGRTNQLHTLQNLYFAITGTELEIKL